MEKIWPQFSNTVKKELLYNCVLYVLCLKERKIISSNWIHCFVWILSFYFTFYCSQYKHLQSWGQKICALTCITKTLTSFTLVSKFVKFMGICDEWIKDSYGHFSSEWWEFSRAVAHLFSPFFPWSKRLYWLAMQSTIDVLTLRDIKRHISSISPEKLFIQSSAKCSFCCNILPFLDQEARR